jgi:hypothetical protein
MEYDRLTVSPKLQNVIVNTDLDEEEANATMDGQLLSSLVGVVSEIDLDEAMLGSLYELKAAGRKSKSSSVKKSSKKVSRVPKSKIVSKRMVCSVIVEVFVTWLNIYILLIALMIIIWILLLFRKLVEGISLNIFSTASLVGKTLSGHPNLPVVDRGVFYLEYGQTPWK